MILQMNAAGISESQTMTISDMNSSEWNYDLVVAQSMDLDEKMSFDDKNLFRRSTIIEDSTKQLC